MPTIDLNALSTTFQLEACAVSYAMAWYELRDVGRVHHYRALATSWQETRDLRARLLALTGHRRLIALWTLAMGKSIEYGELADRAQIKACGIL